MAAATTIAMTAATVGLSGAKFLTSMKDRKRAKNALDNYQRQELNNAFENVQVSTLGSDLMREENARNMATATDMIAQAGDRSIVGGLPKIVAQTNIANQEARKNLDEQVMKRDYAIAGDEQQIRAMKEARDNANISALSSQYNSANQDMWNGLQGMVSGLSQGASMYSQVKGGDARADFFKNNNGKLDNNGVSRHFPNQNFAPLNLPYSSFGSPMDVYIPPNFTQNPNYMMNYEDYTKKYGNPFNPAV